MSSIVSPLPPPKAPITSDLRLSHLHRVRQPLVDGDVEGCQHGQRTTEAVPREEDGDIPVTSCEMLRMVKNENRSFLL